MSVRPNGQKQILNGEGEGGKSKYGGMEVGHISITQTSRDGEMESIAISDKKW